MESIEERSQRERDSGSEKDRSQKELFTAEDVNKSLQYPQYPQNPTYLEWTVFKKIYNK